MNYNNLAVILLTYFLLFFVQDKVLAQSSFSGFISNYNAITFNEKHPTLISGRNTIRLNYRQNFSEGRIYLSSDLYNPYAQNSDSLEFRLREAFFELYFSNADLKIGKQVLSWGKTEGDFILDILSPYDLSEFITRDFSELREGFTGISYTFFSGRNQFQLIANPLIQPSRLPDYNGRWGVISADFFPLPTEFKLFENENPKFTNGQFAVRSAFRPSLNFDIDLTLMRWIPLNPGYKKQFEFNENQNSNSFQIPVSLVFEEVYEPTYIFGIWGEYRVEADLALQFEAAYFNQIPFDVLSSNLTEEDFNRINRLSSGDLSGDNPLEYIDTIQRFVNAINKYGDQGFLIYKPQIKYMAGFRSSLFNWRTTLQYSGSAIINYNDDIIQNEFIHSLTLSLQRSFLRDDLFVRTLTRYNFSGKDFWFNPELRYTYTDGLTFSTGVHLFGGKKPPFNYGDLSFQQYQKNSFVYLSATWSF